MYTRGARRSAWAGSIAALTVLVTALAAACAAPAAPTPRDAGARRDAPSAATPGAAGPSASAGTAAQAGEPRAAPPGPLSTPLKIRLGSNDSVSNAPIYIAFERGYFAEAGLEVEDIRFDSATRMMAPLAAGQLDVVPAAITAGIFNAFARDIDVRMVADRGLMAPGYGIFAVVARQDLWDSGAIRTLADLRGRRVGIAGFEAGSSFTITLGRGLEAQGMSLTDLDVLDLPYPETNAALANRSVEAAVQLEPLLSLGVASGLFSVVKRADELYPNQQNSWLLYAADFARNRSEAGRRFMVAYLRGARDYNDAFVKDVGRDEVVAILARHTPVKDVAIYRQMVPAYINPNGRLNTSTLIDDQDWFAARGYIPQKVDVMALVDHQFADYALSVLGEYR
jgi:NitT/TauT family transport system substrate-binding protein